MEDNIIEYLEVENIGPIKKAKIQTKQVNAFIGKNATGKSIIAKILQVNRENEDKKDYNIEEFFFKNSVVNYKSKNFNNKRLTLLDMFVKSLKKDMSLEFLNNDIKNRTKNIKDLENLELGDVEKKFKEILENLFSGRDSYYIPVERNLVPFFSSYGINLLSAKIPLPQYVIEFATEFRLAKDKIKSSKVFNFEYKFENEEDRVYFDENNYISLKNASSGIQAILPLYLTIEYLNSNSKKHYILEEPELNLFPKEQFEIVKYMIRNSASIIFITHSPYVLYSLNILLYAYKVGNLNKNAKELVEKIIPSEYWINPKDFSAYYFEKGEVKSFFDNSINDNILDNVSIELEEIFDELREIYFKVKK